MWRDRGLYTFLSEALVILYSHLRLGHVSEESNTSRGDNISTDRVTSIQTKCQNGEDWWNGKDGEETDLEYVDELKYCSTTN
jgi:hypothetical protein